MLKHGQVLTASTLQKKHERKNASKWENSRLRGGNRKQNSKIGLRQYKTPSLTHLQTNHLFCVPNPSSSSLLPLGSEVKEDGNTYSQIPPGFVAIGNPARFPCRMLSKYRKSPVLSFVFFFLPKENA